MKKRFLSLVLSGTAVVACSSSPGGSASGGPAVDPTADAAVDPGTDPGASSSGAPAPPDAPAVSGATFRNVGRRGETIRVQVSGADALKQTSAAHIRFTDDNDAPVKALDSDWDGVPDTAEGSFHFDTSTLGSATFDGTITIPNIFSPSTKIKKAFFALENESGTRSPEIGGVFTAQLLKVEAEPCDVEKVESRCEAGLSCSGTPAVCQPGSAPVLSKIGFFSGASPKMVFRGDEVDEDIASLSIEFLDNANNAKEVIISGEGPDAITATTSTIDARSSGFGPSFFIEAIPAASFVSQVPKIAATASDIVGRTSPRVITALAPLPVRNIGQACDADGFDTCTSTAVCFPGIRSVANTCKSSTITRGEKCKSAPALDPSSGKTRAYGNVAGVSLWDAPIGCVSNDATGRPEAAIPLHLPAAVPSLTITTALPETTFDTAVYLVPGCAATSAGALGCNDDVKGFSSTLVLKNVPAGDYTIIVESVQMRGGHFGLAASFE